MEKPFIKDELRAVTFTDLEKELPVLKDYADVEQYAFKSAIELTDLSNSEWDWENLDANKVALLINHEYANTLKSTGWNHLDLKGEMRICNLWEHLEGYIGWRNYVVYRGREDLVEVQEGKADSDNVVDHFIMYAYIKLMCEYLTENKIGNKVLISEVRKNIEQHFTDRQILMLNLRLIQMQREQES